jgi:hypothetical protein
MPGLEGTPMSTTHWNLYGWDEISGLVSPTNEESASDPAWRLVAVLRNGVRQYSDERGHVALLVYAPSEADATEMFKKYAGFFN